MAVPAIYNKKHFIFDNSWLSPPPSSSVGTDEDGEVNITGIMAGRSYGGIVMKVEERRGGRKGRLQVGGGDARRGAYQIFGTKERSRRRGAPKKGRRRL